MWQREKGGNRMLKVDKTPKPEFFTEFKKQNRSQIKNWDDMNIYFEIKQDLRTHMLIEEQNCTCPYCESQIYDETEGSLEHIKPKDKFPELFLEYDNYITSCKSSYSCDNFKGNNWDKDFINPTKEDPEEYFTYDIFSGEIIPKNMEEMRQEKAWKTIELLNLNHNNLKNKRRNFIKMIEKMEFDDLQYINEQSSLLKYYREIIKK